MPEYVDHIVGALQRRGWAPEDARRRLDQSGWTALLAEIGDALPPDAIADDLRRHTRCEICGHPLHPVVGDVALSVLGTQRMIRNLPHTAACSCGYARPLVPRVWVAAAAVYFGRHPEEHELDAADLVGS